MRSLKSSVSALSVPSVLIPPKSGICGCEYELGRCDTVRCLDKFCSGPVITYLVRALAPLQWRGARPTLRAPSSAWSG